MGVRNPEFLPTRCVGTLARATLEPWNLWRCHLGASVRGWVQNGPFKRRQVRDGGAPPAQKQSPTKFVLLGTSNSLLPVRTTFLLCLEGLLRSSDT